MDPVLRFSQRFNSVENWDVQAKPGDLPPWNIIHIQWYPPFGENRLLPDITFSMICFDVRYWSYDICLNALVLSNARTVLFRWCRISDSFRFRIALTARYFLLWFAFTCIVTSVLFLRQHISHIWSLTRVMPIPFTEGTLPTEASKSGRRQVWRSHAEWLRITVTRIHLFFSRIWCFPSVRMTWGPRVKCIVQRGISQTY